MIPKANIRIFIITYILIVSIGLGHKYSKSESFASLVDPTVLVAKVNSDFDKYWMRTALTYFMYIKCISQHEEKVYTIGQYYL